MAESYEEAVQTLVRLGAERVLILQGPSPLQPRYSHGFDDTGRWSDQVSMSVVEKSLTGEPVVLADVKESDFSERWSIQLGGLCSIVCLPFWSPSSRVLGLLYIDTKCPHKTFGREAIAAMQRCAQMLEGSLFGQSKPRTSPSVVPDPSGVRLGLRKAQPSPRLSLARPQPSYSESPRSIEARALAIFFRSLATMMKAGIGIERNLALLGQQQEHPALTAACASLHRSVTQGSSLSQAMRGCGAFDALDCCLVEMGERSGSLDHTLVQIADLREKALNTRMRLQSSLAYPAILLLASLVALILAPPLVLRGQFQLLQQSSQSPPLITRGMIAVSDLLLSPWGWLLLAAFVLVGLTLLRQTLGCREWRQRFRARLADNRWLGPVILHSSCALFARSLASTYRVGIPLHQGLELAGGVCGLPQIERRIPHCLQALRGGSTVSQALAHIECLPKSFLALVVAGQECGRLDATLDWVANFFDMEFEARLESLLAILQPTLMVLMGSLIALLLLATLMPMASLLEHL